MKRIISLIIIISIVYLSLAVYAASGTMRLTANQTTFKAGDEITFTFSINDMSQTQGINAISGTIDYDTSVFEPLKADTSDETVVASGVIENQDGWSVSVNPKENIFAGTHSKATTGAVFTFKLKVKSNISVDSTTVTIKDIKVADINSNRVTVAEAPVTLTASSSGNNNKNNVVPINSIVPSNSASSINDNTSASGVLPKTGVTPYVVIAIALIGIIATVSIIRYKNIIK